MSRKLPENLKMVDENGVVLSTEFANGIKQVIKKHKILANPFTDAETGVSIEPVQLVKNFFLMHFEAGEEAAQLPEGYEKYQKVWDMIGDNVKGHKEAEAAEKADKEKAKEAKSQQKEAQKEAKEKEDLAYKNNQDAFEAAFTKKYQDENIGTRMATGILKQIKLPERIVMSESGLGVVIGDNATVEDLSVAVASIVGAMEGQSSLAGAFQFIAGDLVNAAVNKKLFRTKNEAQGAIAHVIKEKLKKNFTPGSLNQYALMAERVPVVKRKLGIAPTLYLQASKIVMPKLENGKTDLALEKEFNAEREAALDAINNGELDNIKAVVKRHEDFKTAKNLNKEKPEPVNVAINRNLHNFFFASWVKEYLLPEGAEEVTFSVDDKTATMTRGELTDKLEEAKNNLQNILITGTYGQKVEDILAGKVTADKEVEVEKDGKKVKEKQKIEVPVYLTYPFKTKE